MSKKCKYIAAWQWIRTKMCWQPTWHFMTNLMLVCYQALHITISTEILHKPFIWPQFLVLSPSPSPCLLSLKEKVAVHPLHNLGTTERGPTTKGDSFLPIDRKLSKYQGRCPLYMRHKKVEESWPQLPTPLLFWRCRMVLGGRWGSWWRSPRGRCRRCPPHAWCCPRPRCCSRCRTGCPGKFYQFCLVQVNAIFIVWWRLILFGRLDNCANGSIPRLTIADTVQAVARNVCDGVLGSVIN